MQQGVGAAPLHPAIDERWCEPDGGGAEAFDVVEIVENAREVAAVVEAFVDRIEPVDQAVSTCVASALLVSSPSANLSVITK